MPPPPPGELPLRNAQEWTILGEARAGRSYDHSHPLWRPAMQESHPPVDPGDLNALKGGDLAPMERLFRARFADLVKEATIEPGDAAAAPHVVERVFTRLWADRAA